MDSHERFELTMRHQAPDRPPLDIGGTSLTGMRPGCQERLRAFLGLPGPARHGRKRVDEEILLWAGAEFRSVGGIVALPSPHARTISPTCRVDGWGIRRELVQGEWQIVGNPLRDATIDDLKAFKWPEPRVDEDLLRQWEAQARALKEENKYVVVAEHPVYGILELGCWMCGYDDFLFKMAGEPDFVRSFFDEVWRIQERVIDQYYPVLGPFIKLTTSGDDFGTQSGPFMSPEMFGQLIVPCFSARIARTKKLAGCYYWHHSCGSVFDLLDPLIGCGVDILNPIQTSAAKMEPAALKARFGDRIVFWGGVDVQQFLPRATPEQARENARALIATLGAGGGYVMAPAHEMLDDIPPENIVAWVETLRAE